MYEVGRYEFKYLLPSERRAEVLELVAPHVRPDDHARPMDGGLVGYTVHTLYLDTPRLTDYFERLERRKVRRRLRVRTYGLPGEGQPVFLENKRKSGKWVVKHRAPVGDADAWCGSHDPQPWTTLAATVPERGRYAATSFCRLVAGDRRLPVSVVHYQREVLVPRTDNSHHVRLTLDHGVRATVVSSAQHLFAAPEVELIPREWIVMELKFEGTAPGWMRDLTTHLGITAVPVSKFGLSVARGHRAGRQEELRLLTPPPILERRRTE